MKNTNHTALLAAAALLSMGGFAVASPPSPGPMSPPENQKLAHDIFKEIVEVRSVHNVGTKGVADILVRYLKSAGFTDGDIHVLAEEKYPNQVNVVVRLTGKGKGRPILWNGHMDVVEAKSQDWSLPPFQFIEKDGYFYGRGTSDMKDEDAAVAASLIRLKKEGFIPDRDIIVAFTADEEVGEEQDGMWYLVREHKPLVDAEMAINPDGGSGEIDNGHRLNFGIETSQKTLARLYPLGGILKAERQADKLLPTLVPKEVGDAVGACHSDPTECKVRVFVFQADVGARPGVGGRGAAGARQTHGDLSVTGDGAEPGVAL